MNILLIQYISTKRHIFGKIFLFAIKKMNDITKKIKVKEKMMKPSLLQC